MKQTATVVYENGRLMAEVLRPEACASCRACDFGKKQRVLVDIVDQKSHQAGDQIVLEIQDGNVSKASLLAYGIPLVFLLIGLLIAYALGDKILQDTELWQALIVFGGIAIGCLALKFLDPVIKKNGKFAPKAYGCGAQLTKCCTPNTNNNKI